MINYSLLTQKQDKILKTALRLFAREGYDATSTYKVASKAGVSQGLIFRHFDNKEGLLKAIVELARQRMQAAIDLVLSKSTPQDRLRTIVEVPFRLNRDQIHFWRLIYSLEWQRGEIHTNFTRDLDQVVIECFLEMGNENGAEEADYFLVLMDGLVTSILLNRQRNLEVVKRLLHEKYQLIPHAADRRVS